MNIELQLDLKQRRQNLANAMPCDSMAVIYSGKRKIKSNDVYYPFSCNSNFYYLTGLEIENAIFCLHKYNSELDNKQNQARKQNFSCKLLLPKITKQQKIWEGGKFTKAELFTNTEIKNLCFYSSNNKLLDKLMQELVSNSKTQHLYFDFSSSNFWRKQVFKLNAKLQQNYREGSQAILTLGNLEPILAKLRMLKSDYEILKIKKAAQITAKGHLTTLKQAKSCVTEKQIQNLVEHNFYALTADDLAFNTIAAAGVNACTLHYQKNNATINGNELILLDAGAKKNNYVGDVTSIIPPKTGFNKQQTEIYKAVLTTQKHILSLIRPNISTLDLQNATKLELSKQLLKLKIVKFSDTKLSLNEKIRQICKKVLPKFYMHSVSHYIGLDVHDLGIYQSNIDKEKHYLNYKIDYLLKKNMVISVEPGLYFRENVVIEDEFMKINSKKYTGIGVRIEDQILVTVTGYENLTVSLPRTIDKIEKLYNS